jgi:tRNA-specific 2-thiouridylase
VARIAVLMSGGLDSSGAALILKQAGHDLVGLTARMSGSASKCCGDDDIYRAQRVCHKLGIPHRVLDLAEEFDRRVIRNFVACYQAGLTPNPCAVCNGEIKFGIMVDAAARFGFDRVASGHYARLAEVAGRAVLAEPADRRKSQVYFLSLVRPDVLARLEFPLAGVRKQQVRDLVAAAGLPARRSESQDLCFVATGRYQEVLQVRGAWPGPGNAVDTAGRVVGRHRGHVAYTVGQRFGVDGRRLYVTAKCASRNELTVGARDRAMVRTLVAEPVNYFLDVEARPGNVILVRYRYNTPAAGAVIADADGCRIEVLLDEPCFAPAPGQILACYADDVLVAGGVITATGGAKRLRSETGQAGRA